MNTQIKREWLIKKREAKGLSQEEVAKQCGSTQTTICAIELGSRRPSVKLAKQLANLLEFNWVIFYEEMCNN